MINLPYRLRARTKALRPLSASAPPAPALLAWSSTHSSAVTLVLFLAFAVIFLWSQQTDGLSKDQFVIYVCRAFPGPVVREDLKDSK